MKRIIISILPFLALVGCTSKSIGEKPIDPEKPELISVGSRVLNVSGDTRSTRGDGMIYSTLTSDLPASFIRIDAALVGGAYPANYSGLAPKNTTVSAAGNTMTFNAPEYYLTSGGNTKLIGWYPQTASGWNASTGRVTIPIDSSTDIMTTALVEGSKSNHFTTANNSVVFDHALTQVSIHVYSQSTEMRDAWGGIKSIKLKDERRDCVIQLPMPNVAAYPNTASASSTSFGPVTGDLDLVKRDPANNTIICGGDGSTIYGASNSYEIPLGVDKTYATITGYAMFAPKPTPADLEIVVETERAATSVKVNQAFLAGNSYKFVLNFTASVIIPYVSITDWTAGGADIEIDL